MKKLNYWKCCSRALAVMCLATMTLTAWAQTSVRGTVKDQQGNPVPGVSVIVDGTTTGVSTDAAGAYTISVPSSGRLKFTSLGYLDQVIPVGDRTTLDVKLAESTLNIERWWPSATAPCAVRT